MKDRIWLLLMASAFVATAACTSATTTATTNSSAPSVTAKSSSDTSKTTDDKNTDGTTRKQTGTTKKTTEGTSKKAPTKSPITKPSVVESVDKSKLPTKSQKTDSFTGLTKNESDCVDTVIYQTVLKDPAIADNEPKLAGVAGGALVACVEPNKLATAVADELKKLPGGSSLSSSDVACLEGALSAGGNEEGYLIGAILYADTSIIADALTFYQDICSVTLV